MLKPMFHTQLLFMKQCYLLCALFFVSLFAAAQPTAIDRSFGNNGIVSTPFIQVATYAHAGHQVMEQSDGKVLILFTGGIARHHANGLLDSSFGINGFGNTAGIQFDFTKAALKPLVLPNDQIIVTGTLNGTPAIACLLPNGKPNTSFGDSGYAILHSAGVPVAHTLTSDNKILVVCKNDNGAADQLWLSQVKYSGHIERKFGLWGYQSLHLGDFNPIINSILALPGGQVLLGGAAEKDGINSGLLLRLNHKGNLDKPFGNMGISLIPSITSLHALTLLPGGKMLALDGTGPKQATGAMLRFSPNGLPDNSFGANGRQELLGTTNAVSLAVQPNGMILACGTNYIATAVSRYYPDGAVDESFGNGGIVTAYFVRSTLPGAMILQKNGNIALTGVNEPVVSYKQYYYLALSPGGAITAKAGIGLTGGDLYKTSVERYDAIALQQNNKILAVGQSNPYLLRQGGNQDNHIIAARYLPDGSLDQSFGYAGKMQYPKGRYPVIQNTALFFAQKKDGGFLATHADAVYAFKENGTIDEIFVNGLLETGIWIKAMNLQQDGKILLAGRPDPFSNNVVLVRFYPDGSADGTFGTNGRKDLSLVTANPRVPMAVQPNGKILLFAAGVLTRMDKNGAADENFGSLGTVAINSGNNNIEIGAIALQADGKIVLAGQGSWNGRQGTMVMRLLANGATDKSFGTAGVQWLALTGLAQHQVISFDRSGNLLLAGTLNQDFAIAALTKEGRIHYNFGVNGLLQAAVPISSEQGYSMLVTPERTYLAGSSGAGATNTSMVAAFRNKTTNGFAIEKRETGLVLTEKPLEIAVLSNPSITHFTLRLQSRSTAPVMIKVTDAQGKLVQLQTNLPANTSFRLGDAYAAGIYIAEIVQDGERKTLKLIKQ